MTTTTTTMLMTMKWWALVLFLVTIGNDSDHCKLVLHQLHQVADKPKAVFYSILLSAVVLKATRWMHDCGVCSLYITCIYSIHTEYRYVQRLRQMHTL